MYQGDELPEPKSMLQANQFLIFSNDVCSGLSDAQSIVKIERILYLKSIFTVYIFISAVVEWAWSYMH